MLLPTRSASFSPESLPLVGLYSCLQGSSLSRQGQLQQRWQDQLKPKARRNSRAKMEQRKVYKDGEAVAPFLVWFVLLPLSLEFFLGIPTKAVYHRPRMPDN